MSQFDNSVVASPWPLPSRSKRQQVMALSETQTDPSSTKAANTAEVKSGGKQTAGKTSGANRPDEKSAAGQSTSGFSGFFGASLILISLAMAVFTFLLIADLAGIDPTPSRTRAFLIVNGVLVLVLLALVFIEGRRIWRARRTQLAGSQLHTRIVALISVAAALPAIILAGTATVTLDRALAPWFFGPIRSFVEGSTDFARNFANLQCQNLRRDSQIMASDISRGLTRVIRDRALFRQFVTSRAVGQEVPFLVIIDRQGRVFESAASNSGTPPLPTEDDFLQIGIVTCLPTDAAQPLRVLVPLIMPAGASQLYLFAARPFDPRTSTQFLNAQEASQEYQRNEGRRADLQFDFGMMYLLLTSIVLLSAIWVGLRFADWLVAPIGRLIAATDQVASGNFYVQVPVRQSDGDIAHLSETFNKMTGELQTQRQELISANAQIDQRRRFTEAVLSGVPAGVLGLDKAGRISTSNPMAAQLLGKSTNELEGVKLADLHSDLAALLAEARQGRMRLAQGEIALHHAGRDAVVSVRITQERGAGGFVVTLDDMTELVTAQRTSAWADVARRIAHEIKNPLTPIQLSAERIKRKYGKLIVEDREIFDQCTDTIVRQVDDIRRMVDEFSSFARMPKPTLEEDNLAETLKQVGFLATVGYPEVQFTITLPKEPLRAKFDRRLVSQAVTNILKNATEGIAAVAEAERGKPEVSLDAFIEEGRVIIDVTDNGIGFPKEKRNRLLEPYMTTREGGTGLGLPIVGKIFEDHGGGIELLDSPAVSKGGRGARVRLWFPAIDVKRAAKTLQSNDTTLQKEPETTGTPA
jgi:two-component system, NtrC family, nitrogen regulation sensor histidine kinase NtrY